MALRAYCRTARRKNGTHLILASRNGRRLGTHVLHHIGARLRLREKQRSLSTLGGNPRSAAHGQAPGQRFSNRSALFRPSRIPQRRSNACTSARRAFPTTRKRISFFKTEICNLADFIERMAISKASSAEFSARAAGSNGCALRIGAFIVRCGERVRGSRRTA